MLEYEFLVKAIESIKQDNEQGFKLAVTKLHSSNPLDKWRIVIFNKIQNKITIQNQTETINDKMVYLDSKGEVDYK